MSVRFEKRVVEVVSETIENVAVLDGTNAEELIERMNTARAAAAKMKEEADAARDALVALMGGAETGTIGGVDRVKIKMIEREGTNRDLLAEAYPEAYEATLTTTTYPRVTTK